MRIVRSFRRSSFVLPVARVVRSRRRDERSLFAFLAMESMSRTI
jgi:hypothetical protein